MNPAQPANEGVADEPREVFSELIKQMEAVWGNFISEGLEVSKSINSDHTSTVFTFSVPKGQLATLSEWASRFDGPNRLQAYTEDVVFQGITAGSLLLKHPETQYNFDTEHSAEDEGWTLQASDAKFSEDGERWSFHITLKSV